MGKQKNKMRRRSGKFNRPGGLHSKDFKMKQMKKCGKLQMSIRDGKAKGSYTIKKSNNLKVTFSKLAIRKAKKFICVRNEQNLKLTINTLDKKSMPGNRIMNLDNLQQYVSEITTHSATCESAQKVAMEGAAPIKLLSEQRNGLYTILHSECVGCKKKFKITNSETIQSAKGPLKDLNVRGVWGSMVSGGGCTSLNEALGTMGIPSIDHRQYTKLETQIGEWWGEVLQEEMAKAAEEEKEHAMEMGSYFEGVPSITVICDGGWSKRSHKHTYNAMAGVAVIFGQHTGKLLHIGVKNRLCYICSTAQNKNVDARPHQCFKNWSESAQAMESSIILDGFLTCESKYGLRYMNMIGDGDSSVYANIQEKVPVWGCHVKKLECSNHSCKCLRVHLERLIDEKPQYKGKGQLSKVNIQKIVIGVRCAIRMRSKEDKSQPTVSKLQQDIRNAGRHVLGLHDMCSSDFCKNSMKDTENTIEEECQDDEDDVIFEQSQYWENSTKDLDKEQLKMIQKGGVSGKTVNESLLKDLYFILNRMAEKANRLIGNFTSNLAESWMHVRCTFDGGKSVNRCFRGSFLARCYGGSLRAQKGPAWSPSTYETVTGQKPDEVFVKTYEQRAKKYATTKKNQSSGSFKQKRSKRKMTQSKCASTKKAKREYGPEILDDSKDISSEELKKRTTKYYEENVKLSAESQEQLEKDTRAQSGCKVWKEERRKRLTSSTFGDVMSRSVNNNRPALTTRLLYSNFGGNQYTQKGLREEENTRKEYKNMKNKEGSTILRIDVPGLVVCPKIPHLAASSDGIVHFENGDTGLIEIKNLLQTSDLSINQAAVQQKQFCLHFEKDQLHLKKNHKYYHQVQGQLNILQMPWCDFIVRRTNPYDMFIERIERDENLWEFQMTPKLTAFYFSHILEELAAPRKMSHSGIRKPAIPWFEVDNQACRQRSRKKPTASGETSSASATPLPSTSQFEVDDQACRQRSRKTPTASGETSLASATPLPSTSQFEVDDQACRQRSRKTPTASGETSLASATPLPSTSQAHPTNTAQTRRKRDRSVKFVGRHIEHEWEVDDTGNTKWYTGLVTDLIRGKDGDRSAIYEVQYDGEDDPYEVDDMLSDYEKGSIKFLDL